MTDYKELFASLGIPVELTAFKKAPSSVPFIVLLVDSQSICADGVPVMEKDSVEVYLYTKERDYRLEAQVEDIIATIPSGYKKETAWDDGIQCHCTVFTFSNIQRRNK